MKKILLWGRGNGFRTIMETARWKQEVIICGIVESGKTGQDYMLYDGISIPVYGINQVKDIEFDYIVITNRCCGECLLIAQALGVEMNRIVVPCVVNAFQSEQDVRGALSVFVENPSEVMEKLSALYQYKRTGKRCLIIGGVGEDWDYFKMIAKWKKEIKIVGAFNYENQEVVMKSDKVRLIRQDEIQEVDCDYILMMDSKYYNDFAGMDEQILKKIIIPYAVGLENSKYDVVVKLNNLLSNAEEVVDYLSVRHTVGRGSGNMRPMKYDLIGYTLMNDRYTWEKAHMRMMPGDYARVRNLELLVEELKIHNIRGAMAEVGVYRGDFAKIMSFYFPDKELYLYDTFEGYDSEDLELEAQDTQFNKEWTSRAFKSTSLEDVKAYIGNADKCHYRQGYFPRTIGNEEKEESFCLVSLDANLYNPTMAGLAFFYPRLVEGGFILLHEYNFCWLDGDKKVLYPGIKKAVRDYEKEVGHIACVPVTDQNGTLIITK